MYIHEFQAKEILRKYGIPIPPFNVISSPKEIEAAIDKLHISEAVVKVQIHAGGRGKAGGVKLARNANEIISHAKNMLGMKIVNSQTGEEGIIANRILITPLLEYEKEYYLGVVIDRQRGQALIIASPEGGMEIEEVAVKKPDKILRVPIQNRGEIRSYHLFDLLKFMGWEGSVKEQGTRIVKGLARAFWDFDASLLEINPLVKTARGDLYALDAKLSVDDNALYRQPVISSYYDRTQLSRYEVEAKEFDLAYVAMTGNIGCMVNGAGLAMATMDIIHYFGGAPANFLDVGGGASQDKIMQGFNILLSDPKVNAILINIFGGIMNCATLASGLVAATHSQQINVPLVIRMEGTNVEEGKRILENSPLRIDFADGLTSAAEKVVAAAKGNKRI